MWPAGRVEFCIALAPWPLARALQQRAVTRSLWLSLCDCVLSRVSTSGRRVSGGEVRWPLRHLEPGARRHDVPPAEPCAALSRGAAGCGATREARAVHAQGDVHHRGAAHLPHLLAPAAVRHSDIAERGPNVLDPLDFCVVARHHHGARHLARRNVGPRDSASSGQQAPGHRHQRQKRR